MGRVMELDLISSWAATGGPMPKANVVCKMDMTSSSALGPQEHGTAASQIS